MNQNEQLHELALFAGAGGSILGGKLLGWKCVCAVEFEPAAQRMLAARQDDGCLDPFPIWDDVRTFDGKPWRGLVDVVSGGFPCQDISAAGKGAGLDGERSGLWSEMSRIIGEVGPRYVLVENSPVLTSRGLGVVLGDLAEMGYDARWGVLGACDVGAPHKRERIWIVAESRSPRTGRDYREAGDAQRGAGGEHVPPLRQAHRANGSDRADSAGASESPLADSTDNRTRRWQQQPESGKGAGDVANADEMRRHGRGGEIGEEEGRRQSADSDGDVSSAGSERGQLSAGRELTAIEQPRSDSEARSSDGIAREWWATEPDVGRVAHGVAARVDRLRALGNGQVPAVVALAWNLLR